MPEPMEFVSHSPAETEALGERWGDLGAGKTQLVKGLARGLAVTARVHSPTFTLVNEYGGGRLKLFHLDLYRLETPVQILSAGIEEFLSPDGVAVIEWAERLAAGSWQLAAGKIKRVRIVISSETERKHRAGA
jgi:tRNA threonylcarbamoyladenosine biosynthesis protein TsaE